MARVAVPAVKPMSDAARKLRAEDRARVQLLLDHRFEDARLVRDPEWLNADVVEALFTIPGVPRRRELVAWVCRSGSVQIFQGWEVP